MSTIDEMLDAQLEEVENPVCSIDRYTRKITLHEECKFFGVENDKKVERIKFECPKEVGDENVDLTTCQLFIAYENAEGEPGLYEIRDVSDEDEVVHFSWLLDEDVTRYKGEVKFIFYACKLKGDVREVAWNTIPAIGSVEGGLKAIAQIEEKHASIIESMLLRIGKLEEGGTTIVNEQVVAGSDFNIDGFGRPAPKSGEIFGTTKSYSRTDYIDVSSYDTLVVHVRPRTDSVSPCVWFDKDKNYISGEVAEVLTESDFTYDVPSDAVYAIFSSEKTTTNEKTVYGTKTMSIYDVIKEMESKLAGFSAQSRCYISPSGSDDNDGLTAATPVLTLAKAQKVLSVSGELIFLEGDYHNISYDLSKFAKVSAAGNARLIYYANRFTSAELVEGYKRVYMVPYAGDYSNYLWQLDTPDVNTLIGVEEHHPLQRGRSYRLEHTRMYPVVNFDDSLTDLYECLDFMDAITDKCTYYMDGTNLYFTTNEDDFELHPIIIPGNATLKASEKRNVQISGLKIYFAGVLTTNLSGVIDNMIVGYNTDKGAIRWDNTFGLAFNNCEAVACSNDGINGHTAGDVVCHNCWGHDNSDDGESDHETCHIIQYGGLYEYNGNGCTPASGASGEYINTICRKNGGWGWVSDPAGTGFSAQNTSTTDPALMYCISCYSIDNKIGFRQKTTSKATFVNCISKNDETAFVGGTQIDCVISGDRDTVGVYVGPKEPVNERVEMWVDTGTKESFGENVLLTAINEDGTPCIGANGEIGYKHGYYYAGDDGSCTFVAGDRSIVTGLFRATSFSKFLFTGNSFWDTMEQNAIVYDKDFNCLGFVYFEDAFCTWRDVEVNGYIEYALETVDLGVAFRDIPDANKIAYVRFGGAYADVSYLPWEVTAISEEHAMNVLKIKNEAGSWQDVTSAPPDYKSEEWTFTMEDGSTATKQVMLK